MQGGNWLLVGGNFSRWEKDEQIFGWWGEDSSPSPSRENPDLHSTLRCFWFQGNLYTMFVILDIKFRIANINSNLLISTMYYLLNWANATVCSCSQKSWILLTVSVSLFSESYMNSNDFAVYCHKVFYFCAWQVWFYLMLSRLNPSLNFHK